MFDPVELRNMNVPAPLAVLGFLGAMAGLGLSAPAVLVFLIIGKGRWALRLGVVAGTGAVVYFALLFGASFASREATLAQGQEKYFCEIDCHLAYSVVASREEIEGGLRELSVTLRTRFDPNTISPQRSKDAPLTPNPRLVLLVDGQGRDYGPFRTSGAPLSRPLIPGESYESELVFRVPADTVPLRLFVASSGWEERFLIGGENSLGHKKTFHAVATAELADGERPSRDKVKSK